MRNSEILREKFAAPGSVLAEVNEALQQSLIFEVLLDIRKLLIGLNNLDDRYNPLCLECGEPMVQVRVFEDRASPTEGKCLACSKEDS